MAKIRAVLDQETWVEVDIPDEFQAIVTSLFSYETLVAENPDDAEGSMATSYEEVIKNNDSSHVEDNGLLDAQNQIKRADSSEIPQDIAGSNTSTSATSERNKSDVNSLAQNNSSTKERGKSTSHTLLCKDVGYHMVNWLVLFFFFFFFLFPYLVFISLLFLLLGSCPAIMEMNL